MIEVTLSDHAINRYGHDTLRGKALLDALREAGIPVLGEVFVLSGIKTGTLTYSSDDDLDGLVHRYCWREDANDRKEGQPLRLTLKGGTAKKYGRHAIVEEEDDDEL